MDSDGQFGMFNDQLAELSDLGHIMVSRYSRSGVARMNGAHGEPDHGREIGELQYKLQLHAHKKEAEIMAAKEIIQDDLKTRIGECLRDHIRDSIKTEVATQVKQEVDTQIRYHIPISLTRQAVDANKGIADMRIALANSEARAKNASIHMTDQDEPLAPVLKADGTRSELFPADLRTLLSYDFELVKMLVRDYELPEDTTSETNLMDQFMKNIG
ncbi:hypothetical protein L208DRAFT_1412747 [Tricholoma matsutake]|nr:hypothetical protein L208DRAFT_1412747 [Tricholoma matsutake 945]